MRGCNSRLSGYTFMFLFSCRFLCGCRGGSLDILVVSSCRSTYRFWNEKATCKLLTTKQEMKDSPEKCSSIKTLLNMKHYTIVERLTEHPDKDGLIIVILDQVNLRNLFLPWFQLLLYTFHKKFRHPAFIDKEKQTIINNTYRLHARSLLLYMSRLDNRSSLSNTRYKYNNCILIQI